MRTFVVLTIFLTAFSINAERSPLSPEQLQKEADQICTGVILEIQSTKKCYNHSCTNYRMDFIAKMDAASCTIGKKAAVSAHFFKNFYTEGFPPVGARGHHPQPSIGQAGTLYLTNEEIVYPNGWVPKK